MCVPNSPKISAERRILNFSDNWKYMPADEDPAKNPGFDESRMIEVNLPHHRENYPMYKIDGGALSRIRTVNWYRRHFSLPEAMAGKRIFVEFEGAGQINKIYVNGYHSGEFKGAFSAFTVNITDYTAFGDYDNVIAVQTDNNHYTQTMPPGTPGYQIFGGLHGQARMTVTDRAYIDCAFHYNDAITEPSPETVLMYAEVSVKNTYASAQAFTVENILRGADGAQIAADCRTIEIGGGCGENILICYEVNAPRLWHVDDPYLYTAETALKCGDLTLDVYSARIGIRSFLADSAMKGEDAHFYLNGGIFDVIGINKHTQWPYIGNSLTRKLDAKDAHTIKYDLGLNFVRTSHYEPSSAFLAECDRIGLVVMPEALGSGTIGSWELYKSYLRKLVRRYRNHASVVMWSVVGNEPPADYPSYAERVRINAEIKALDPSRLTVQTDNKGSRLVSDVYVRHDYSRPNKAAVVPAHARSWFVTEWNNNTGRNFIMPGDSELRKLKQLLNYAGNLEKFHTDSRILGALQFEFGSYIAIGSSTRGSQYDNYRCTGIIGPMRDKLDNRWLGYLYQSQNMFAENPDVLHICSEWKSDSLSLATAKPGIADLEWEYIFPDPLPPENSIYVASNFDKVELYYIDEDAGINERADWLSSANRNTGLPQGLWQFTVNRAWTPASKLVAKGYRNGETAPAMEYTRYASSIDVEKEGAQLILHDTVSGAIGAIEADGSDLAWIVAELADRNGQREYYGDEVIKVSKTSGDGEVFHGGDRLIMNDGLAGFYIRSALDKPGAITAKAEVYIGRVFDDGHPCFEYSGKWKTYGMTAGCDVVQEAYDVYGGSFHRSDTAGSSVTVAFTGTQIALYGEYEPLVPHKMPSGPPNASVSVDGGAADEIYFVCADKFGHICNHRVYLSEELPYGEHTLTLKVLTHATPVRIDRVKVFDGRVPDVSAEITVMSVPWNRERVPLPKQGCESASEKIKKG